MKVLYSKVLRYLRFISVNRKYFRNWFLILLTYFLIRRGLLRKNSITTICRDNAVLALPYNLYVGLLEGLSEGLFNNLSCRDVGVYIGKSFIPFLNSIVLKAFGYGWQYNIKGGYWFKGFVKFKNV
jgi:hypothetical protein